MPPKVALSLCIVFVVYLLRLERKQSPHVSFALWIPTIWMLCIASKPLAIWFRSSGAVAEAGSSLDQYFLMVFLLIGLGILLSRNLSWSSIIKENVWLMLLIVYMLFSVSWSEIPFISFKRWIRELVAVVVAFVVLTERDSRQAMLSLFRRTIYILIPFSILLIKYFPEYGVQYGKTSGMQMWIGVTLQKNGLGRLCMIAAFFLVWSLVRRWREGGFHDGKYLMKADVSVLILTLILLRGPGNQYSATALASLAFGLATFAGLLWLKKQQINLRANTLAIIMAVILGLGILQPMIGGAMVRDFASHLGREVTMTGRTEIWGTLVPVVMQNPILGNGFGAFWTPENRIVHRIGEAHSGYLDVLLELGFVGMFLLSMFLLSSCRKAQRAMLHDFYWASLWICFLFISLVHNISETSFGSFTTHLTAIILFLTVSYAESTLRGSSSSKDCNISKRI